MKTSTIHITSLAINAANISTTTIDGVEHYRIRGVVPIVDDIVMNGGLYPGSEIATSYQTMNNVLMPLDHPVIDGQYVSARDPRAINVFHAGAWAENVEKNGDRVVMDVLVNKPKALENEKGQKLVQRLDAMIDGSNVEPIHVSTGLLTNKEKSSGESKGKKYTWIARNMNFDHVAILLDTPGAGTPEDGVGMFVNSDGEAAETVNLLDSINALKDGLINKAKYYFSNASTLSFDQIHERLTTAINIDAGGSRFLETVWPDRFIYQDAANPVEPRLFEQRYKMADGDLSLIGLPVEVVRKPTEYEIKTNGEINPMKNIIINTLRLAGIATEGLSDDQLMDAYNKNVTRQAKKAFREDQERATEDADEESEENESGKKGKRKEKSMNSEAPAWFLPFASKLDNLAQAINSGANSQEAQKRAAVKSQFNLDDAAVNALQGAALDGLFAQCNQSRGINPSFDINANQEDHWKGYDLNSDQEGGN